MAEKKTVLKKGNSVSVQTKSGRSYSYKYTDLAQIHEYLEEQGLSYEATIQRIDGEDYMFITKIDKDGNKSAPMQEAKIPKVELSDRSNAAQEYGSALTYARRYSLLMAYGLATEDDDAASLNRPKEEGNRLDFDEVKQKLASLESNEKVSKYAIEIAQAFPKMTDAQRIAVGKIFDKRRKELANGQHKSA